MEWLIEMLHSPVCNTFINGRRRIIPHQLILDAKEKHKKEIIEAYVLGSISLWATQNTIKPITKTNKL